MGGGGGCRVVNLGVFLVRVSEPLFQNLSRSYTWPLKKMDLFIYLISKVLTYSYTAL